MAARKNTRVEKRLLARTVRESLHKEDREHLRVSKQKIQFKSAKSTELGLLDQAQLEHHSYLATRPKQN